MLSDLGVGRLLVVGAETDACVRSTLHGAFVRGYDTTLVSDAHTTSDLTEWGAPPPDQVIAHTNLYWSDQRAPGRTAGTVATEDVDFGAARCLARAVAHPPIRGECLGHLPERRGEQRAPGTEPGDQPGRHDLLADAPRKAVVVADGSRQQTDRRPQGPGIGRRRHARERGPRGGRRERQQRSERREWRPEDDPGQLAGDRRDTHRPVGASIAATYRSNAATSGGNSASGTPNARPIGRVSA